VAGAAKGASGGGKGHDERSAGLGFMVSGLGFKGFRHWHERAMMSDRKVCVLASMCASMRSGHSCIRL
jgi:hypothetical protein